jgi:transglutaminase-like putative cysteine protease
MDAYLAATEIIDHTHPAVRFAAHELAKGCEGDEAVARACYTFVRDRIRHTGDSWSGVATLKASEVLALETGWCYAKSHLLVALLRANDIPAGLCYQRLNCNEYEDGTYCLHGLAAVYLEAYGWYRIDARGNKEGVDARFDPPQEHLAFALGANEYDVEGIFAEPLPEVVAALKANDSCEKMVGNFPDLKESP